MDWYNLWQTSVPPITIGGLYLQNYSDSTFSFTGPSNIVGMSVSFKDGVFISGNERLQHIDMSGIRVTALGDTLITDVPNLKTLNLQNYATQSLTLQNLPSLTAVQTGNSDSSNELSIGINGTFIINNTAIEVIDFDGVIFDSDLHSASQELMPGGSLESLTITNNNFSTIKIRNSLEKIINDVAIWNDPVQTTNRVAVAMDDLISARDITVLGASSLSFGSLDTVMGDFTAKNGIYGSPGLSQLQAVGRNLAIANTTSLTGLDLANLKSVGGTCDFRGNQKLRTVNFPALVSVNGDFMVEGALSS
jgi:hypothetical protein